MHQANHVDTSKEKTWYDTYGTKVNPPKIN
jgi:hypothetical protein